MIENTSPGRTPESAGGDPPSARDRANFDAASAFSPRLPTDDAPPPDPAEDDDAELEDDSAEPMPRGRGSSSDPFFGYLIALALAIGLAPLIPDGADLRYVLTWGLLALFGVLAWLFGSTARIEQETPENIVWGIAFGLIIGAPILLVGGSTLSATAQRLFTSGLADTVTVLPAGVVLSLLVFTQPLAETLFFRGVMQENRSFWLVGALSSLWALVLFLPMLEVGRYPVVAVIVSIAIIMLNVTYSYVRQRNGLAAAWVCQIVVNLVVFFLPYLGS